MNTPLSVALGSACDWLQRHPGLKADPEILLEFVAAWVLTTHPSTEAQARCCGIHAVKECAGCVKAPEFDLIEPEDLRD